MPILTEPYSKPEWAFLHGLGDTPSTSPQLTSEELSAFQNDVVKLTAAVQSTIGQIDAEIPKIQGSAQKVAFQNLVTLQRPTLRSWYSTGAEIVGSGTIEGKPITRWQAAEYLSLGSTLTNTYAEGVRNIGDVAPGALIRLGSAIGDTAENLGDAAKSALDGIFGIFEGLGKTLEILKYLPWILIGGAVLFYVVPTVLRARREGSKALEEDLRAGRARVESGARAGVKAGKLVAAAYTGNPSIAMSGLSRRRRRK